MRQGRTIGLYGELDASNDTSLSESSVVAVFVVSPDGRIEYANATLASWLGAASATALVGRPLVDLTSPRKSWREWRHSAVSGRERGVTVSFAAKGRTLTLRGDLLRTSSGLSDSREDGRLHGVFVDVTEESRLRAAVQRGARMEALGGLTSGIAHDFNNLLTVLVGNLYLVAEELRDRPKTFAKLKSARDAAKRGADLIRQLLAFARREAVEAEVVDPGTVIEALIPLLRRALGTRVCLSAKVQPDAGKVRCNAAQLESVLVNLSVNARDAIEGEGNVLVSVENASLTLAAAARHGLHGGDFVRISVIDDGVGIPADALESVFEPFFTTKGERGGTGLGLSMVRWFTEQTGGAAYVESEQGKGTRVSLLLPKSADTTVQTSDMSMPLSTLPSGSESVLVFSRDEGLRSTLGQILEVLGYDVKMSADPTEAIHTVQTTETDLLLIDAAAAEAPAQRRLLREALAARPQLKVIVATDSVDAVRARVPAGVELIGKPFSLAELAGTLRKVLK
ncbi:MAG: PAS domain-containing protein [Gammaproteobacteria bacterium]|nr:PAS domain-containing protein [Gammaproteobacteria bacterium]